MDGKGGQWGFAHLKTILSRLIEAQASAIGVSLFIDNPLGNISHRERKKFQHPSIVWMSKYNNKNQLILPYFASERFNNFGTIHLTPDSESLAFGMGHMRNMTVFRLAMLILLSNHQ